MGSRGWIKLHRKIQDHWIYQEKRQFSRYESWLDLIMMANHKDNKALIDGELITIEKGSFITSKRELGRRWDWSNSKVDKFLDLLKQDGMIAYKSDTKKTVISIGKYEAYHELEKEKRSRNETETNQKHNRNETETNKQELKELKNLRTKELKESTTTVENDAIVFYQNNIGMLRPIISEEILDWINDLGDEMVIESLKRAIGSNKANWGYAKAILKSWHQKGIKTVEQADAESIEFQNQQQSRFGNKTEPEIQPEWFKNRNKPVDNKPGITSDQDRKEQEEVEAMLRKYS